MGLFVADKVKEMALYALFGVPIIAGLLKLIRWGGDNFFLYVWAFASSMVILMNTIYPVFIKPLFNKLEPLEPGSLRDGIESLAKTVGFPLRKLFVMDGSKRSSHSNAFLFGFGSNQSIVLFDTLVKQVKE